MKTWLKRFAYTFAVLALTYWFLWLPVARGHQFADSMAKSISQFPSVKTSETRGIFLENPVTWFWAAPDRIYISRYKRADGTVIFVETIVRQTPIEGLEEEQSGGRILVSWFNVECDSRRLKWLNRQSYAVLVKATGRGNPPPYADIDSEVAIELMPLLKWVSPDDWQTNGMDMYDRNASQDLLKDACEKASRIMG